MRRNAPNRSPLGTAEARVRIAAPPSTLVIATLVLLVHACGGGNEETGGAAGAGPLPSIGMTCTKDCMSSFCERTGVFAGQCTAGCNSGAACQLIFPGTACFGTATPQCGLMCTTNEQCPLGTACVSIDGKLGCRVQAVPPPAPGG